MVRPKLSIVTVCFNEEKDIGRTCESIIFQTYKDYEWIVVDGNSKDETLQIVKKYRDNITNLISENDTGVYDAMNKGIRVARGEYLLFLNGGDYFFADDVLEKVFGQGEFNVDILYGDCCIFNKDGSKRVFNFPKKISKNYFINNNINHQSTFIKKELFDKYGSYDESYRILADYEKWLCFMSNNVSFKKMPFAVAYYKGFNGLSSSEETKKESLKEKERILKKYYKWHIVFLYEIFNKVKFLIFSPQKFLRKYINKLML